jgi:hypothetical protein
MAMSLFQLSGCIALPLCLSSLALSQAPDWARIRSDHPRLFFNADTWPTIKARAEGPLREHFTEVRKFADSKQPPGEWSAIQRPPNREGSALEAYDWGGKLMGAALVQRIEPDPQRLERIRQMLWASLDYYHACFAAGKSVNWYGFTRLEWLCALDWLWNDLPEGERAELARGFLTHVDEALHGKSKQRQNRGGFRTGYYGDDNLALDTGTRQGNTDNLQSSDTLVFVSVDPLEDVEDVQWDTVTAPLPGGPRQ